MTEIKKLQDVACIKLLDKMFVDFGIRPLDAQKKMEYWTVKSPEISLLDDSVLSVDELGNELRAIFFVTRKQKNKKPKLFRFTELFDALHTIEKDVAITEVIEIFASERPEYIRPISVVCLGSIEEDGILYSGCFLINIPPVDKTDIYPEEELYIQTPEEIKQVEEVEEKYN